MGMFRVTVTFDRKNPVTKKLEENSVREGTLEAKDARHAKTLYLKQFKKNEPTRRRIKSVEVHTA